MSDFIIRSATIDDLPTITEIYNQAIRDTVATFDTETKTPEEQRSWFEMHDERHPFLVAEQNGTVVGWASLSAWSARCAYAETAEISLYIDEANRGRGIGRALTEAIITAGQQAGLHSLLARIAGENEDSIRMAESFGFVSIGVMKEVGRKFGRRLDVVLMQLIYD